MENAECARTCVAQRVRGLHLTWAKIFLVGRSKLLLLLRDFKLKRHAKISLRDGRDVKAPLFLSTGKAVGGKPNEPTAGTS